MLYTPSTKEAVWRKSKGWSRMYHLTKFTVKLFSHFQEMSNWNKWNWTRIKLCCITSWQVWHVAVVEMLWHLNDDLHNLGGTGTLVALVVQLALAPLCLHNSKYSLITKLHFTLEPHFECLSLFFHPWPYLLLLPPAEMWTVSHMLVVLWLDLLRLINDFSTSRKKALFWDLKMRFWLASWSLTNRSIQGQMFVEDFWGLIYKADLLL